MIAKSTRVNSRRLVIYAQCHHLGDRRCSREVGRCIRVKSTSDLGTGHRLGGHAVWFFSSLVIADKRESDAGEVAASAHAGINTVGPFTKLFKLPLCLLAYDGLVK